MLFGIIKKELENKLRFPKKCYDFEEAEKLFNYKTYDYNFFYIDIQFKFKKFVLIWKYFTYEDNLLNENEVECVIEFKFVKSFCKYNEKYNINVLSQDTLYTNTGLNPTMINKPMFHFIDWICCNDGEFYIKETKSLTYDGSIVKYYDFDPLLYIKYSYLM